MSLSRFGIQNNESIDKIIEENVPKNTINSKKYTWKTFMDFCNTRKYELDGNRTIEELALILKDWAVNMKKRDGTDFKEATVKTMWNVTTRKAPKVPIKTYRWEDIRRSRRRGGYPWTHLYKRPFNENLDPYPFTMDALRRSKSASTMGARSDGVDISEVSSFVESGKTTPSFFLHTEFITEPSDNSAKHSRAGSEVIEEYVTEDEKDIEDDVQIKEFRTGSVASSDNISQYLDKEERGPGNSNSNQENGIDEKKEGNSGSKRAKSEETAKRKRKLSADSSYSRYSLSKLGIMNKLRDAKSKINDATSKIKVPKISFPTKKILRKRTSPPKDVKKEDKSKKDAKKEAKKKAKNEAKTLLEPSKMQKTDKPIYIHIPLKPPPGETDNFSNLESELQKINDENELDNAKKSDSIKSGEELPSSTESTKLVPKEKPENKQDEKMDVDNSKNEDNKTDDQNRGAKEDDKVEDKDSIKRKSPFSSLARGPRVTTKPPLKINPAFKQFLKDVRELKDKEMEDVPKQTQDEVDKEESKGITVEEADTNSDFKVKQLEQPKLDQDEQLDLEEQQTSDSDSPKEHDFDKLFEASASKKKDVSSQLSKNDSKDPTGSSRIVRSRSAEPERKRKSSIDSSYSRKSLSKLGIIKKLKEASEKIKGAFSLSSLKRSDSKKEKQRKEKESKESVKKDDDKENKVKKHKLSAQEKLSQLGKPKHTEPVYIHIPLKPPPGVTDEFSHLDEELLPSDTVESKKEERTDSLDSMSPVSTKNDDIHFIFLTPPSDDEVLDEKDPDIPETPSSDDNCPVFFGTLKKLAERVVDQISPETKRKSLETVSEENDKGSAGEMELNGKINAVKEISPSNKEEVKSPPEPESKTLEPNTDKLNDSALPKPDDDTLNKNEPRKTSEVEKMIVDVEDGLNEPSKTDELKSVLKSSSSENTSPVLKKKVSFKRKTKPTKIKVDSDNGYEPIEAPKGEQTVNVLEQTGIEAKKDTNAEIKESIISQVEEEKKKFLVGEISQSMSVDEEKGYLDQKIVKDTSLEEDYNKWSKSGDHEYEPINPPNEVTLMTTSVLPGVTVIDTNNEAKIVISATEILDQPNEGKKKSFFQFGRFNREKVQGDVDKGHGGSSDDRSRSSQGREIPEATEQPKATEGPNKFQVAFRQRTDQLKNKTKELRNKVRNIKKPNIHLPKAPEFKKPEFKKPEFKKPNFKKPEFKKPDFKKFKFERPKINLHLPKIPDTATIHLPHVSLPGAKKTTVTRTVETRQYSTESNAGDSGSTKPRSKFDFNFSKTFPRFKKKKAADDPSVAFGTTPRAKKDKDQEKRTTESSASSVRIPLHSDDSMDAEDRLKYDRDHEQVRSGYEDRETSEDIDRSSRMRFDNDIAIEDEYERETQEINRAEYLNRWQHGNLRQVERDIDDPEDFEDEIIVEQLVEHRFKKIGPGYGTEKHPEPNYERYDDNRGETLEDRLRRDEDRPRYSDDDEEFERRLMQNKELITDLDNLEEEEDGGMHIRDGYSSEGSVSLQKKGRLGKLDIDSDEFFVVHEIREGFQTPANALAQMNEYDPIGSNRSLPQAPSTPSKRKPIKKPKRKKTPHVSQEEIPGDEESIEGVMLPSRPKRKSKKNKQKPNVDDGIVPYQRTINLEHEDSPRGERLDFPRESLGILGDDEGDDHEFEMYENEKMQGKEQPEILVTDPYKQFQIMEQQMRAREEAATKSKEPSAPPRRHRSLKSLTQSENDSILTDKYDPHYREPTNIEDYINPAHQREAPPSRPSRRSRSNTSSLSRVSLPPSLRDTDSLLADEAFLTENQPIPSYLIENQSYRQQYKGNQAIPAYLQEDQPIQPCVEEPCVQDLRDYMGYSIVDKSRQRDPPLPPPRTPPRRRRRQIDPEQKFATVPRSVGSSQPETSQPVRPLRNYSTLSQVQSSNKGSSHYENDKENRGNEIDIGQYIEIEEDPNRDLISGDVVQKMRQRPLPAPPRPPRKTKTTRRSLQDITSKENIIPSSSSPQNLKPSYIEEETVSTQTEPLPPDFVCEEIRQEPTDTILTPRISEKVESTIQKRDISKPQTQKFKETEPQIRRELITPTVYSYEETVTHGSLLVEPLNGAKVVPDHQLSRERLVPVTQEYSDEESSEVPESFLRLTNPEETKETQTSQKPMDVLRTDKLQVSDLDVDRLRVNELLASKIVVSEIDSSSIFANEIQSKSGALRVGEIELPPRFLEEIVRKLEQIRPSEGQRLQEAPPEEKKTPITEHSPQSVQTLTEQASVESPAEPSLTSIDSLLSPVDPSLSHAASLLSPVNPLLDSHYHPELLENQHESTVDLQQQELQHQIEHELSPEPPVPPPRSYTFEDTPPDAPPRTLRRKSKDSPRTTDTQRTDQSDSNFNQEKTDEYPQPQDLSTMEMLEPDIDDHPPPRPPEPLEGLYMPSQPPASFYALRAKQYVGLESENIPTAPRRKRHQKSRSRPVSRSRSTSDDSSVTPSHPQVTRSPRSTRLFSEPSIPELSGRLIQACGSRINNSLKRLIYYLTENILRNADGKQDLHVFMIILLVLIAGLILLGYGEDKTIVHLHHWEFFNPPKDL